MKKNILPVIALSLLAASASARDTRTEGWQEHPKPHQTPAAFAGESAIFIEDNVLVEYKDEADRSVWMYTTSHRIIKVLDDKGIESFNKVNIPVYQNQKLEDIKARTILPGGAILDIAQEKMKTTTNDDGSTQLSFAMDGVEKDAEIEILTTYKKEFSLFGKELCQFSIPVVHSSFELTAPARLKFEEKGYGGYPNASDTVIGKTQYLFAEANNIPSIQDEEYGFEGINRMSASYKLSYMPEKSGQVRLYTWQDLAKRLYTNIYETTDKEQKAVTKYLESIGVGENDKEEDKIKKIESAIKSGITLYKEINDDNARKLENIISKKSATETGLLRLYAACLTQAGVKHELGATTNRTVNIFDPEFENWNSLDEYVIYFPDQKKFLSPIEVYYRYPFTAARVITNKGVFCKLTTLGDITNAIADIRTITPLPATESDQNIVATISFNTDMEAHTEMTHLFRGYCAMGLREEMVLLDKEKQKELVQNIFSIAEKPEYLLKYAVIGEAFDNYSTGKSLEFTASVKTPQLVEKAGNKYLFRLGDVIGRQTEMYQSKERKEPLDLLFPHYLNRTITVNIPDGYKVLNPESIKIHTDVKNEDGIASAGFYSDYTIEGNKLVVTISEFYIQLHYPISGYEPFRKVINASADFNKVTLLLDKAK